MISKYSDFYDSSKFYILLLISFVFVVEMILFK